MSASSWANAYNDQGHRADSGRTKADGLEEFAGWIEGLMRRRGYDIDSPRGGGKSKLADDAGVHRAAVSRLLQRQSMPDLKTMRQLATVLAVPLRDMLIRSGRLSEDDLPLGTGTRETLAGPIASLTPAEAARLLGVPSELQDLFVRVVGQFLPEEHRRE